MDQDPLVNEQVEAGARLLGEFESRFPVRAALWLKATGSPFRYLYIVVDPHPSGRVGVFYEEVLRILRESPEIPIDPFRIKVIRPDDPLALDALGQLQLFPHWPGIRIRDDSFGRIGVDDVYIYPRPIPAAESAPV